jgi:hypothetical protein
MKSSGFTFIRNGKLLDYDQGNHHEMKPFTGTHPAVIQEWLTSEAAEQHFTPNPHHAPTPRQKRHRLRMKLEDFLRKDLSKRHFTFAK